MVPREVLERWVSEAEALSESVHDEWIKESVMRLASHLVEAVREIERLKHQKSEHQSVCPVLQVRGE